MKTEVLDHGYVELVEAWGHGRCEATDAEEWGKDIQDHERGIIEAARQSTQGAFRGWEPHQPGADGGHPGDRKLLTHLFRHRHHTPFEFAGMVLEVQAPIFVFREWHRHRTQSYNEMSARYAPLPDLYYQPTLDHVLERARPAPVKGNRQQEAVAPPDPARIATWVAMDEQLAGMLEAHYREGLAAGVPKELARKKMPVDHYSRMRASANLRNWLQFLVLRCDPLAQWEIRQYAWAVAGIVERTFPNTHVLWKGEQP